MIANRELPLATLDGKCVKLLPHLKMCGKNDDEVRAVSSVQGSLSARVSRTASAAFAISCALVTIGMPARSSARILVVDDDVDLTETICDGLRLRSYVASGSFSALEAIAQLEAGDWDLLLSDISMPGMSGIELLAFVSVRWPGLRVILMTAMLGDLPQPRRGMAARLLRKPFTLDELAVAIEAALER